MLDSAKKTVRPGSPFDAPDMVQLINLAGEGLPLHYWGQLAEDGEDPWKVGMQRARRDEGSFSWRNATISKEDGRVAALLMTYFIGPDPQEIDPATMPPMFVPLQELENEALDTLYVNVLATYAQFRNRGHGSRLLQHAEAVAGDRPLSIIVVDGNSNAMRLYANFGFKTVAQRPIVEADGWTCIGDNYVLMIK